MIDVPEDDSVTDSIEDIFGLDGYFIPDIFVSFEDFVDMVGESYFLAFHDGVDDGLLDFMDVDFIYLHLKYLITITINSHITR